jgi:hypothetical protein
VCFSRFAVSLGQRVLSSLPSPLYRAQTTGVDLQAGSPNPNVIYYQFTFAIADGNVPTLAVNLAGITAGNDVVAVVKVVTPGAGPQPIVGSPWSVVIVPGPTNAGVTTAAGPGLVTQTVGEPTEFIIQSKDDQGNNKLTTQVGDPPPLVAILLLQSLFSPSPCVCLRVMVIRQMQYCWVWRGCLD